MDALVDAIVLRKVATGVGSVVAAAVLVVVVVIAVVLVVVVVVVAGDGGNTRVPLLPVNPLKVAQTRFGNTRRAESQRLT